MDKPDNVGKDVLGYKNIGTDDNIGDPVSLNMKLLFLMIVKKTLIIAEAGVNHNVYLPELGDTDYRKSYSANSE